MNLDGLFGLSHHDESRPSCRTYHENMYTLTKGFLRAHLKRKIFVLRPFGVEWLGMTEETGYLQHINTTPHHHH